MNRELFGFDAYSPAEIAARIENTGVIKARLPLRSMVMLGVMAGVFIGLGAMMFALVTSDTTLGFAASRLAGGLSFSLGLILVVVAGAELFTGNNLIVMACVEGKITVGEMLRNWGVVCLSNFVGTVFLAAIVYCSGHLSMNNGAVAEKYLAIAMHKCTLHPVNAFFSGVLCNILVCLAVWMTFAGRTITDRILAILFPITAFVAAGFEHSIANMYFIPMAIILKSGLSDPIVYDAVSWTNFLKNIIPVILGNLAGGSLFVAIIYKIIYLRKNRAS